MPPAARCLTLAGALLLAGCGLGGGDAAKKEEQRITKADLAAMVLLQDELGSVASGLRAEADVGPVGNAEAADGTLDPQDTGKTLAGMGRITGHELAYERPGLVSAKKRRGVLVVGTEVELLRDSVYAAKYLNKQLNDFQRFQGRRDIGLRVTGVSTFDAAGIGEEADGLRATGSFGGLRMHVTLVAFRRGRLVGVASLARADTRDIADETLRIARRLDARIQGVLAGTIEPEGRSAPETTRTAIRGRSKLPNLTLTAADVGAKPIKEGPTKADGYVAFDRTFEDIFAKDAHLIRLHAQTQLYPTAARARDAHRLVTSAAGRRAYARVVLGSFERELGVKLTDIQITLVSNLGPGVKGVDVVFTAGGTPFRFTTGFASSGRAIQAVTGFCRAYAFHPSDLGPLAQRARERLATAV